jgi:predicted MFS family arabinose efflux permease
MASRFQFEMARDAGMSRKAHIMLGMFVGTFLGGYVPSLWGDSGLSMTSVLASAIGGVLGIWLTFKWTE